MKGKPLTIEEFVERARSFYGDKYDYSKVDLNHKNEKGQVCILYHQSESEGGQTLEFWRGPIKFLEGKCCFPAESTKKANLSKIVAKCKEQYGDLYDLSRIETDGYDEKYYIWIGCPTHGWVKVNMHKFQEGAGCPECNKEEHHFKYTTETYIEACKKIHGDKYDLSEVVYNGIKEDVRVICYKHGPFNISADSFLRGHGCEQCGNDKLSALHQKSQEQYIEDCKKVHGDEYDLSSIVYIDAKHDVTPTCKIHGPFRINASSFLCGCGCSDCYGNTPLTTEEFVQRATKVHNGFYTYPNTVYKSMWTKVKIECPEHGEFDQYPADHLIGKGCKKCARQISKAECSVFDYIASLIGVENVIQNDRTTLGNKKELDIYIPSKKIAIEYDGLVWHSDKFGGNAHSLIDKTIRCDELGIRLIHIYEDEWVEHQEIVQNKLKHILGFDKNLSCIGARKCMIMQISNIEAQKFLDKFHIQGYVTSTLYYGAYYNQELVGVMTFLQEKQGYWNLTRFASDTSLRLPGLANKIFKYFLKNTEKVIEVKTFLDRRWGINNDNVYHKMGFKYDSFIKPDYYYIKGQKRYHKFGFRKQTLHKKYGLPLTMTESEMTISLGYNKIWNCGLFKYVWKNSQYFQ